MMRLVDCHVTMLQVPTNLALGSHPLTVTGSGGLTFSNSTTLTAKLKFLTVLVQTDKATYKPGDLGIDLTLFTSDQRSIAIVPFLLA